VELSLDRAELLHRALAGHGAPATQIVPPAIAGHDPGIALPPCDRPRARELLAQAGYTDGLEVDLYGSNNRYVNDVLVLKDIGRQLGLAGIRARVNALDKGAFFPLISAGRTRMHLVGWSSEAGDAGDALDALAHSKREGGLGAENDVDLADPDLDALIESANATLNGRERVARLQRAMRRLVQLRVYLPLYVQPESALVSTRIAWDPAPSLAFVPAEMHRQDPPPRA
jgi:peptide/nickel transport system substrate-binding protein